MKVVFTYETNLSMAKIDLLNRLCKELNTDEIIKIRDFDMLFVGIICVRSEFINFYKKRRTRVKKLKTAELFNGVYVERYISMDIELDFKVSEINEESQFLSFVRKSMKDQVYEDIKLSSSVRLQLLEALS